MLVCRNMFLGTDAFILGHVYCIFYLSVVKLPTILPFIFFTQLSTGEGAFSLLIYCCSFVYYVVPVLYLVSIITQVSFIVNFSLIVFIDFFCDVYMTFKEFLKIYFPSKRPSYATFCFISFIVFIFHIYSNFICICICIQDYVMI